MCWFKSSIKWTIEGYCLMFCCITFNIILMQETFHGQASKSVPEKMSEIITVYVLLCTLPECFDKVITNV